MPLTNVSDVLATLRALPSIEARRAVIHAGVEVEGKRQTVFEHGCSTRNLAVVRAVLADKDLGIRWRDLCGGSTSDEHSPHLAATRVGFPYGLDFALQLEPNSPALCTQFSGLLRPTKTQGFKLTLHAYALFRMGIDPPVTPFSHTNFLRCALLLLARQAPILIDGSPPPDGFIAQALFNHVFRNRESPICCSAGEDLLKAYLQAGLLKTEGAVPHIAGGTLSPLLLALVSGCPEAACMMIDMGCNVGAALRDYPECEGDMIDLARRIMPDHGTGAEVRAVVMVSEALMRRQIAELSGDHSTKVEACVAPLGLLTREPVSADNLSAIRPPARGPRIGGL